MQFDEMGNLNAKTLMLLPGTACDYQTNFAAVLDRLAEKYLKPYKKHFRDPEIREFDMQHEQWLLGEEKYTFPVLEAIDEFMETPV